MLLKSLIFLSCLLCLLVFLLYKSFRRSLFTSPEQHDRPANFARPRISRDPALIRPEYDIVVIGSGYGGGVAASRLARTGKKVCVLERGAEVWAGQFPHTFRTALRNSHISDVRPGRQRNLGKLSGLYQTYKGKGQDIFSGCGLGGTSLINAGVFLRADSRIFQGPEWPVEIRENKKHLGEYYQRGERMFRPSSYPESLPKPRKLSIFEQQSKGLGLSHRLYRPPLTTSFDDCNNGAGVTMRQSTGSGNECTGLNDGSKNSVLVTYLADAWTWGAELFCGVDVTHVRESQCNEGYLVYYTLLDSHQNSKRKMWIRAKELVVFGAGAVGTTEILLRSHSYGLPVSPLLGQRISGNGDLLAFAYNSNQSINAVGGEACSIPHTERCGPTITACIDLRGIEEARNVRDGFIIQEGAIPGALGPVIQAMLESRIPTMWSPKGRSLMQVIARMKSWVLGPYYHGGSVNRTGVYLVMSHDGNEGTMECSNGRTTLQWSGVGAKSRNDHIKSLLIDATASIEGTFVTAPSVTVHPLGGVCMSNDSTGLGGVVDHMGNLFTGSNTQTHKGIVCVDASIIPTSLGVNPCATITALAERCCDLLICKRGWTVDERPNEQLNFQESPFRSLTLSPDLLLRQEQLRLHEEYNGLKFDEVLQGFLQVSNDNCSFEAAAQYAKASSSSAQATITVGLYSIAQRSYTGFATGILSFGALSKDPLLITRGHVDFFTIDEDVSDAVNLIYRLELLSTEGKEYVLYGCKTIDSRIVLSPVRTWIGTTTLYTTISQRDGTLVAKGILRLSLRDFVSELFSLRCEPRTGYVQQSWAKIKFLSFFAHNVLSYVLSPLRPLQYSGQKHLECGDLKKTKPIEIRIRSSDGVEFCIKKWEASPQVTPKRTPIVLIPGASVDDRIFSLPTIRINTIDYFSSQGYRCYVPVLRFGIGGEAKNGWTAFDARLDVKAALEYVRVQEDNRKIYAIVHCLGSIATATALLHGDVEASWLCGITCSQVFTDLIYSNDNDFKARHQALIKAYRALAGNWFSCRASPTAPLFQRVLDQLLRFYPTGSRKELCNSAVCHRCDVPFGRCWSHSNLNHATHARLHEFFDGIHMNFLIHLSKMGATPPNHIRKSMPGFADLVTSSNLQRLEGLPMCFLSGGDNAVWKPSATKRSLDVFRQTFPYGRYERVVVQGYGHLDCWMGKAAYRDVYPRVMHHIKSCEPRQDMCVESGTSVVGDSVDIVR